MQLFKTNELPPLLPVEEINETPSELPALEDIVNYVSVVLLLLLNQLVFIAEEGTMTDKLILNLIYLFVISTKIRFIYYD